MAQMREIEVGFYVGSHQFRVCLVEYSDAAALAKAKAVVSALSLNGSFISAHTFEVIGQNTDEDY